MELSPLAGPFYPADLPHDRWFEHYSRDFDTVEINNTFYQQPDDETFDHWREQAPAGFLYAVKANRYLTHMKKLKDPRVPLERFLRGAQRLQGRLGPILYQLPPHWCKNLARLEAFVKVLPKQLKHVVEFRERDWLADDMYALLSEHDVSLCVHDMLRRHPRRVTGPIVYVRFHGAGRTYGGKYRPSRLGSWGQWITEQSRRRDVFAYFNNDENAHAVRNARELREICAT